MNNRWIGLRLDIIGNLVTILVALFVVVEHGSISGGLAGLSISFSLNVNQSYFILFRVNFL
jgi:ATP-binding cassette, subfamily C (CFTR/MRP), member 1